MGHAHPPLEACGSRRIVLLEHRGRADPPFAQVEWCRCARESDLPWLDLARAGGYPPTPTRQGGGAHLARVAASVMAVCVRAVDTKWWDTRRGSVPAARLYKTAWTSGPRRCWCCSRRCLDRLRPATSRRLCSSGVRRQRLFLADTSHEPANPLTSLQDLSLSSRDVEACGARGGCAAPPARCTSAPRQRSLLRRARVGGDASLWCGAR